MSQNAIALLTDFSQDPAIIGSVGYRTLSVVVDSPSLRQASWTR